MAANPNLSIFPDRGDEGLKVKRGDNKLETCFPYTVTDSDGDKIMCIKFYDKALDVIGKDGSLTVGSRFNEILGSKREMTKLESTFRGA